MKPVPLSVVVGLCAGLGIFSLLLFLFCEEGFFFFLISAALVVIIGSDKKSKHVAER